MSEWHPFVTLDKRNDKERQVAATFQSQGEQFNLWPYTCRGKKFIIAIYAKSFFRPMSFVPTGFLILDENAVPVEDVQACQNVVRDFNVWLRIYFHPIQRYVPFQSQYFAQLRKNLDSIVAICRQRLDNGAYKRDDPGKKAYYDVLKELDLDVVNTYSIVASNITFQEKIINSGRAVNRRCSCENVNELKAILTEYKLICSEVMGHLSNRAEIFYRYERAIKDAYHIDLQVSSYSVLSKGILSFLLWLAGTGPLTLFIPFLPEGLKLLYQETAGYKSLLKKSEKLFRKSGEVLAILGVWSQSVDNSKIRNFS